MILAHAGNAFGSGDEVHHADALAAALLDEGDGGGSTGPVITNVEGTKGLAYEVVSPKKGAAYAICTGIGTATDTDIVIASHYDGFIVEEVDANAFKNNTS